MESRFDGWCRACESAIDAGDEIVNNDGDGWVHEECAPASTEDDSTDVMADVMGSLPRADVTDLAAKATARREAAGYESPADIVKRRREAAHRMADALDIPVEVVDPPHPTMYDEALMEVTPQPEFKSRDRYGRYVLAHPGKAGKRIAATRCTTFVKAAEDGYKLEQWHKANVAMGLGRRPDLAAMAATMEPGDRRLEGLVKDAEVAGGGDVAANLGTAIHSFTETVDWGRPLTDVPEAHRDTIRAYRRALVTHRLAIVPAAIERITLTSRWDGIAGTFDRVYRLHDGTYVVGDVKSGKVGYDPKSMYAQMAVYAEGINEVGVYDVANECWERLPFEVRTDLALIVHLPAGGDTCDVYRADLAVGRAHLDMCAGIRRHRKIRHKLVVYSAAPYTEDEYRAAILAKRTRSDLAVLGQIMVADEAMTPELFALAREHRESLPD